MAVVRYPGWTAYHQGLFEGGSQPDTAPGGTIRSVIGHRGENAMSLAHDVETHYTHGDLATVIFDVLERAGREWLP